MTVMNWLETTLRRISPRNQTSAARRTARPTTRKLQMETLDGRLMMSATQAPDWYSKNLPDTAVANMARQDYAAHKSITRDDMLSIFTQVGKDGTVTANELTSLQTLSRNAGVTGMPEYVRQLLSKVSVDDPANKVYQYDSHPVSGHANGDLFAGATKAQLDSLVNKWFKGTDLPSSTIDGVAHPYKSVDLPLMVNDFSYSDVRQGGLGDCTLMASIAEVAARKNSTIQNMFIDNKDGTYTVRLYNHGVADYLTVNKMLPDGGNTFARVTHSDGTRTTSELWVSLAEKAIVQQNASGYVTTMNTGVNSYSAIDGGNVNTMKGYLNALTGLQESSYTVNPTNIADAMKSGKMVLIATGNTVSDSALVPNHCYAVPYYDASSSMPFRIFNPWGFGNLTYKGHSVFSQIVAAPGYITKNFGTLVISASAGNTSEFVSTTATATSGMTSNVSTTVAAAPLSGIRLEAAQPAVVATSTQSPEAVRFAPHAATLKRAPAAVCVDELMANWDFGLAS